MMNTGNSEVVRLAGLIKPRRKTYLLGLLGCCFLDATVAVVFPLLMKFVLDAITDKNMDALWMICLQFTFMTAVLFCLTPLFRYLFGKTVKSIMIDIRSLVFRHLEKLPVSYYENTHSGDSISRINNDIGVVENALTGNLRSLISLVITGVYAAVFMMIFEWRFAVALILMGLVSTYVNSRFAKPLRKISTEIQQNSARQLERLMELISGTQVSRIFQMIDKMNDKYKDTNQTLAKLSISRMKKYAFLNSTNFLLSWFNNGGVFILGSIMIMNGLTTVGTLLSLILLLDHVTNVFRQFGNFWSNLQSSLAGAARVFEILDTPEEPERYPAPLTDRAIESIDEEEIIRFRNGSFSYHQDEKILDDVSFAVEKGQLVAFVGPSGGGKSTIIKLLLGFYPLREGEIQIEGKPLTHYSLSELRDKMAYVSQDGYLFEGTIEENIRYGRMDASFEEVAAAAQAAHAHDFIIEQPEGYNTMVGERGMKLSGGQKQRITIARALLKNAPILLLDEATSALDSESEQAVQQGLQRLMEGKTTLSIAHRLSTIQEADMIFVIDKGRIVEQGRHAELIEAGGIYCRLYHMQDKKAVMQ